ncbi:hypothetical protein INR49_018102, partial [Caranx melampygus]
REGPLFSPLRPSGFYGNHELERGLLEGGRGRSLLRFIGSYSPLTSSTSNPELKDSSQAVTQREDYFTSVSFPDDLSADLFMPSQNSL